MQSSNPYPGPGSARPFFLFFLLSVLAPVALLAACDNANPTPTLVLPRGQAVYARYCNTCHPGGARGAGPSLIELAPRLSDEQIRDSVRNGINRMPAYSQTLISDGALTDLIAYIRTLK